MATSKSNLFESGNHTRDTLLVLLSVWGLCLALLPARSAQTNGGQADAGLNEGIQLFDAGRFFEAVTVLNRVKQAAPRDPRPYFYSGMALTEAGRLSAAASELKEAVRLSPVKPEYFVYQANVLALLDQKLEALRALAAFEKASDPKQLGSTWLKLLAEVYFRLEKLPDALRVLALASERAPADSSVDFDRGRVYVAIGRPNLAAESFQKSIEKSGQNPAAYFELGKILYQRNELVAAKKALTQASRQDGTNSEYLLKLALVCLTRDEVDEALEHLRRAEPSAPDFPEIYFALGRAYQRKGQRDRGEGYRKQFERATSAHRRKEQENRAAERFVAQGERQLDQGNSAEARALFEQAARADPSRWDAHAYLAEMLLSSEDLQLAYPHLLKMEEIDPDSVVGNYLMATYWYKKKDFERARACAEKAKWGRPGNSEIRNLLGNVYLGLGRKKDAREEYEAAVWLAPDRAEFRENLTRLEDRMPER